MAKPKLTNEQRTTLLNWLAADYDSRLIKQWFEDNNWPTLSDDLLTYYRHSRDNYIAKLRQERRASALISGLALKEERVARLAAHADALEAIKWVADEKTGRLWNEKAWRETLADIAAEMGHRKVTVEIDWRERAKQDGYDADALFTELVNAARARLVSGSDERSGESSAGKSEPKSEMAE